MATATKRRAPQFGRKARRPDPNRIGPITSRRWVMIRTCLSGASTFEALQAVGLAVEAHPEWDLDELRTWNEWEANADALLSG